MSSPIPSTPLTTSYTYSSPKPSQNGPYIMGIDEAGRGPVLGPMVYGVAYCPKDYQETLEEMGFNDSKQLTAQVRAELLDTLCSDPTNLAWSVRVLSPQDISSGMLRHPPTNLNQQAMDATVQLIRQVIDSGITLSEVYVDALGPSDTYQAYLSKTFTGIDFTVTPKADSKYKIVGAASVAAKVVRDMIVEDWKYAEGQHWSEEKGSGYPSDPKTQAWLKSSIDPVFGFPGIVRFSWSTVKLALEKGGSKVEWIDETQASLIKAFGTAVGRDKDRCKVAKDLGLNSVGSLAT